MRARGWGGKGVRKRGKAAERRVRRGDERRKRLTYWSNGYCRRVSAVFVRAVRRAESTKAGEVTATLGNRWNVLIDRRRVLLATPFLGEEKERFFLVGIVVVRDGVARRTLLRS